MNNPFELAVILDEDISAVAKAMEESKPRSSALDRSYVRTVFSALEGVLFALRQEIIQADNFGTEFMPKERAFILEKKYNQRTNTVTKHTFRPSIRESICTNTGYYARSKGLKDFRFPETSGWDDMKKAITIRNRITHPKSIEQITITNEELEVILRAKKWFTTEVMAQYK
ncbi:hypothetical protein C9I98_17935 [Photobacterium sanctipauli]|jgi:hypothetical protein|uniref:RiboL-PSP-HEPN domain-containing protein n=1 Tax=Photobacterium sanctipauli TaxID=1342794 RepID=A0A2T3NPQ0_9GAMM|nr:hypothetical protein [Photobacterium sanctipauli]EHH2479586.1 hypothetical protein [Vibrio vulnificus]EKO3807919.1 hypothetical protein [Vibrio harveyi]KOO16570.1 hypothetical protein AKJ18_02550 [Vibrio xuii]MBE3904870.1 hypothetical protein [Vibrio parahaemolyticus]EHH2488991.1 hypothetical protein [Vibrio vulnificus]